MQWVKRVASLTAGIIIFNIIVNILNYMYIYIPPKSAENTTRILLHNFYEDKGKIDNLFLGSSHVYNGINPFELDRLNGKYNFNLATAGQLMNGTYYLLKEADKYNELSHVYVDLYYFLHTKDNFNGDKQRIETAVYRNWMHTDYMKLSLNKIEYMFTMTDTEKYPNVFFAFSRYRADLDKWEIIKSNIEEKGKEDYINFKYDYVLPPNGKEYDEFGQKGYRYSVSDYHKEERIYKQDRILGENSVAEKSEEYLREVIVYCQKRNIPITLFVTPMYELQLISTENYDNYLNQVKEIAAEYNVDIYDFNLAKDEYLPIQDTKYFSDVGHLNYLGMDMYTRFFHKIVTGGSEENKKYFYDSYAQKLENSEPEVYGIYYRDNEPAEDGTVLRNMFVASNRKTGMEYRIIMTPNGDKEQYMVQDFNENRVFAVDANESGICTVVYRMEDAPDEVRTIEVDY